MKDISEEQALAYLERLRAMTDHDLIRDLRTSIEEPSAIDLMAISFGIARVIEIFNDARPDCARTY